MIWALSGQYHFVKTCVKSLTMINNVFRVHFVIINCEFFLLFLILIDKIKKTTKVVRVLIPIIYYQ